MDKELIGDEAKLPPLKKLFGAHAFVYAFALLASGLMLSFDVQTFLCTIAILVGWGILIFTSLSWWRTFCAVLTVFFVLMVSTLMFELASGTPWRPHQQRTQRMNEMRNLTFAILNYESAHRHFPENKVVVTPSGETLCHSWRIEILPYLEAWSSPPFLYDYNEPWNGPNNSKLADHFVASHFTGMYGEGPLTSYKVSVGPSTVFERGKNVSISEVEDGSSQTIAIIEDHANPVHWMAPDDLTVQQAVQLFNNVGYDNSPGSISNIFGRRIDGFVFTTLDGSTNFRWAKSEEQATESAFLMADGEGCGDLSAGERVWEADRVGHWKFWIHLALIFLPAVYLLSRKFQRR